MDKTEALEKLDKRLETLVWCKQATQDIHQAAESGDGIHDISHIEPR